MKTIFLFENCQFHITGTAVGMIISVIGLFIVGMSFFKKYRGWLKSLEIIKIEEIC